MRAAFLILCLVLGARVADWIATPIAQCEDPCEDDDEAGTCPPSCSDCACCAHATPTVSLSPRLWVPFAVEWRPGFVEQRLPRSIDPRDILHVPIATSA